jgi:hypothetical protein
MTGLIAAVALMLPGGDAPPKVHKPKADHRWKLVRPWNAKRNRIAMCESGMRWHIATGNGFYGGLQFSPTTWWSVGGRGMPHTHTPLEQKFRAVRVFMRRGSWGDWPVCGWR